VVQAIALKPLSGELIESLFGPGQHIKGDVFVAIGIADAHRIERRQREFFQMLVDFLQRLVTLGIGFLRGIFGDGFEFLGGCLAAQGLDQSELPDAKGFGPQIRENEAAHALRIAGGQR